MDKGDLSQETQFHQTPQKDQPGDQSADFLRDFSTPLRGKLSFGDEV